MNDLGFEEISFDTVEYTNLKIYKVYIHVCVRIDVIEQLKEHFIKFFDERSKFSNATCNINCSTFIANLKLAFEIKTPEEVTIAIVSYPRPEYAPKSASATI